MSSKIVSTSCVQEEFPVVAADLWEFEEVSWGGGDHMTKEELRRLCHETWKSLPCSAVTADSGCVR